MKERINRAIEVAVRYGGIDGDHHKAWVIDQMVRHLTGCPTVNKEYTNYITGEKSTYLGKLVGESEEYKKLVKEACAGEDGPNTYTWDEGIAP